MDEKKFNPQEHLIKLKGDKDYLQVQWRVVWFRVERPDWSINTELINYDAAARHAIFKATISDADGKVKATATGSESAKDFLDYIEKAETKAIGRALAILGFGTQFVGDELDEGQRIVDAPVSRNVIPLCSECGQPILGGKVGGVTKTGVEIAEMTREAFGVALCGKCASKR